MPVPRKVGETGTGPRRWGARLIAVLETAVDAIIISDEAGRIELFNPAAERLFGYSAAEVIGRNVTCLMPEPFASQHDQYITRYLTTGERRIIGIGREVIGRRKDGTTFPIDLAVGEAQTEGGRVFTGIIRDLTERKRVEGALRESEERFRNMADHAPTLIWVTDATGACTYLNRAWYEFTGQAEEAALGFGWLDAVHPDDQEAVREKILTASAGSEAPRPEYRQEYRLRRKDGEWRWVIDAASPRFGPGGEFLGFIGSVIDITERKEAEEAVRASNQSLQAALAELQAKGEEVKTMTQQLWQAAKLATLGELAAGIAHELNNPLATVSLRVESLLDQTPASDPKRHLLEVVEQEVERMAGLVANLLQFSRRAQPQVSTVDVPDELLRTLDLVRHLFRNRRIDVTQDFAPNLPMVHCDRQSLRQVFLNLLTNAADAMPNGGTLTLRMLPARLDNGAPAVAVEVRDTGVGIPPENLPKVMEPFFTTKEEGKGTGLGLSVCRRVMQEQRGTIRLQSEVGRGTTVRITLPVTGR